MNIVDDSKHFKQPFDHDDDYVSRAEIKRKIVIYQTLGKQLVALGASQLDRLNLDEMLYDNILKAKTIRINTEAHRRQLRLIGKLMRNIDVEQLKHKLKNLHNQNCNESARLNKIEKAKNLLLDDGDPAIQALIEQYPLLARQKLRQLVRQANKQLSQQPLQPSKSSDELSKYLREMITD